MIYLEQLVNSVLLNEGQTVVTLEDLQISWKDVENLFITTFEKAKSYITIYDWVNDVWGLNPQERDYAHVKHITYNPALSMQRIMPDLDQRYWEYNPYTKNGSSIVNANFSLEVQKYPTLENLEYKIPFNVEKEKKKYFSLPCSFHPEDFKFADFNVFPSHKEPNILHLEGDNGVGRFDTKSLTGHIFMDIDYEGELSVISKYVGIKELDMNCELFVTWFTAALMQHIGAVKRQIDLSGVGLPFDINADGLLERGRQLMDRVEELKATKSHWSNF